MPLKGEIRFRMRMGLGVTRSEGFEPIHIRWLISRNTRGDGQTGVMRTTGDSCSGLLGDVVLEHLNQFSISVFGHEDDDTKAIIP